MLKSLITEYGLSWVISRTLYSIKLLLMRKIPFIEKLFEKRIKVKRVDIFEIDVDKIREFLSQIPDEKKLEVISIADKAIEGKIKAFSSVELDYGNPINWHYNPVSGVEVGKNLKWYNIPDFDPERGDIKIIWEASRFTHFIYFARAYLITKEKKYYTAFSEQLNSWVKENNYSYGVNYKCGQEVTLRMINALLTYTVFKAFGYDNQIDKENIRVLVEGSYKKVLSNFFYAHKCIKNNHTLSEITGLIIGAWCSGNQRKLKRAYKLLNKEIQRQFSEDGGYIQNSFNYQRLALQLIECIIKISYKTNHSLTWENRKRIINSANLIYQVQHKSGDVPNRGANDGALIFPVTSCSYRDFKPVVNTINYLLNNTRLYQYGLYDEEILWFSNKQVNDAPISSIKRTSSAFYEAGIFTLRHSEDSYLMTILKDNKTRPGHMDQLHIDIWYNGINIFCDNGSYSYADPIGKKLAFTSSHNTVKVNNVEQMNKKGAFLVTDWSKRKEINFKNNSFEGTMISKNNYKHTRKIIQTKQGYSIIDNVIGAGEYCEFYFHTPCNVKQNSRGFELFYEDNLICDVSTDVDIDIEIKNAYRSLYYLKREEINRVIIRCPMIKKECNIQFEIELKPM